MNIFEKKSGAFAGGTMGDIDDGRENLGTQMPVEVYRLFQYKMREVLTEECGKEKMIEIFRKAGYLAGVDFANKKLNLSLDIDEFLSELHKVLAELKIGILRVEKFDASTGNAVLTISEDLDCSGLPILGETVCNYDEGFISGILQTYTHHPYTVIEVDCWATGDRVCRFDAKRE